MRSVRARIRMLKDNVRDTLDKVKTVMICYRGDFGVYYIRDSMPVPWSYHLAQRRAVGHERIPVIRYGRCGSDDSTLERDGQLGAQERSRTSQMLQLDHIARSVYDCNGNACRSRSLRLHQICGTVISWFSYL